MEANHRIHRARNKKPAFYPTGQVVGPLNRQKDCRQIMYGLLQEYAKTVACLHGNLHGQA